MDNTKQTRQLKVYSSRLHYADNYDAPCIRIEGKWLSEYGFKPGDYIAVECKDGELLIKKDMARVADNNIKRQQYMELLSGMTKGDIETLSETINEIKRK